MSPQSRLVAGIALIIVANVSFQLASPAAGPKELLAATQPEE